MRKHLSAAVFAVIAALATALPAYAASAILTVNGQPVPVGDVLRIDLKGSATFRSTSNNDQITCTKSSISAKVVTNSAPGSGNAATLTITSWTFDSCTTNFGATVQKVTFDNLPYNMSITDPGGGTNVTVSPGSSGAIHLTIVLTQVFQFTCGYIVHDPSGDLFGTSNNTDNSLTFTNQQFDLQRGPNTCFPHLNFSAKYAPILDTNQGNGIVFVN